MAFPINPTNGQTTTVNGVLYTYSSALGVWTVTSSGGALTVATAVSATGNITGGNLISSGTISATTIIANLTLPPGGTVSTTGNITGSYFLGNGSQLSGVITTVDGNTLTGSTLSSNIINSSLTSVGTLGSLSVAGTATAGNLNTAGTVSATGNITGGNISATNGTFSGAGSFSGNINMNNQYINNVTNPVQNQDAATKAYVDQLVSTSISYHAPVVVATTTTLNTATGGTVSYNQPNGAGNGVGATLTTTGTYNLIDSANVQTVGTRILVKNEANAAWNGIYTYANTTAIVRSTDTNTYGTGNVSALGINDYFFTTGGTVNEGTAFIVNAPTGTITFGTSNITFATFSTSQVYDAGTGLSLSGTTFNVNASQTQITSVGTLGSLSVTGTAAVGNVTSGGTVSAVGNVNGGNILTGGLISATGNITGGTVSAVGNVNGSNILTGGLISATGNITGGNVSGTNIAGTLTTAAQTNITAVGTLSSLSVTGNVISGNVGVGTSPGTKLDVSANTAGFYATRIFNTSASGYGIKIKNGSDANDAFRISNAADNADNILMYGSGNAYFAGSLGLGTTSNRDSTKFDVRGDVSFGSNASYYGTLAYNAGTGTLDLTSSDGSFRFIRRSGSVASATLDSSGRFLIGYTSSQGSYALQVSGNVYLSGTLTEASSIKLKENVKPITNALDVVCKLEGVTYDRKDGSSYNEPGFIAEKVAEVIDTLVDKDENGKATGVKYTKTIAYLVEAIKELKAEVDLLKGSR